MKIKLKEITVRDLTNGYQDKAEDGVVGYGGKLDIRPPYQREFIYNDQQRDAVIDTITKKFPLNVMYWAVRKDKNNVMYWAIRKDKNFEIIDGQQRTISVCQYVKGDFSFNDMYFHNLQDDEQEQILNYKLMVYLCSGTDSEKLKWFKTINIAGEKLTNQELRNAVYSGSWVTDAKRYFSKTGCAAYGLGSKYLIGSPIRQEYLETAIKWISENKIEDYMGKHKEKKDDKDYMGKHKEKKDDKDKIKKYMGDHQQEKEAKDKIEDYMGKHQQEKEAKELWEYFQKIIKWIEKVFTNYRKEMKGLQWGALYSGHKSKKFDASKFEDEITKLMEDDDVTNKKGIYEYVLTRNEKYLNIRAFSNQQKREAYEKQKGICAKCEKHFEIEEMEADHIKPWHEGGKTTSKNCQMLCIGDNRTKSGK